MRLKSMLPLFVLLSVLFSCSEKLEFNDDQEGDYDSLEFLYKEKIYSSTYELKGEDVIIHDQVVAEVYDQLMENEELATLERADGKIEYFDSYNDLITGLNLKETSVSEDVTRYYRVITDFRFYEHKDYGGWVRIMDTTPTNLPADAISSFQFSIKFDGSIFGKCYITIFTGINLTGYSKTFELTKQVNSYSIENLSNIHYKTGVLNWKRWNDVIKSANYILN